MQSDNQTPCRFGFGCKFLFQNRCRDYHPDDHVTFAQAKRFLVKNFSNSPILATVKKQNALPDKLLPLNKRIFHNHHHLSFYVYGKQQIELSEKIYYEIEYLSDVPSKQGQFFVKIVGERKDRDTHADIEAFLWKNDVIYREPDLTNSNFQYGIVRSKHNGTLVIKSHMGKNEYFFKTTTDMNRALVGCKVKFIEVEGSKNAKVISIEKNPLKEYEHIYGYLEISPVAKKQIKMQHLYYPLPENVDWDLVHSFIVKTKPTEFLDAWKEEYITREQFKNLSVRYLNIKQENHLVVYITQLLFGEVQVPKKKEIIRRTLSSLSELDYQQVEMKKANFCFLKPLNTKLPTFICLYIQDHLKTNPDIWRQYVKAKYVDWPSNSDMPFALIQSAEGQIGHPQSDPRIILTMNSVKTDGFPEKAMKQTDDVVKEWSQKIELETQIVEEKIFSIDGEKVKNRDDAFSVRILSKEGGTEYEIGIHIADVTKLIKKNSDIFKEAESRFHSTYIGKYFFRPMLPIDIQNILSLQESEPRYVFSVYVTLNKDGHIERQKTRFAHNTIRTTKNFTYEQADSILKNPEKDASCEGEIVDGLVVMKSLAEKIAKMRDELGLKIDLEELEDQKTGKSAARMIVEQFMVLANEVVTDYVGNKYKVLEKSLIEIRNNEKKLAKANIEEVDEVEDLISDEESIPEIEEQDSEISESEEETEPDLVNLSKIEENSAKAACRFLENVWKNIDEQKVLDLSNQKKFAESIKSMMDDSKMKQSLRAYLKYLLRVSVRNTNLVIKKKLDIHGEKPETSMSVTSKSDVTDKDLLDEHEIEMIEEETKAEGKTWKDIPNTIEHVEKAQIVIEKPEERKIERFIEGPRNGLEKVPLEEEKTEALEKDEMFTTEKSQEENIGKEKKEGEEKKESKEKKEGKKPAKREEKTKNSKEKTVESLKPKEKSDSKVQEIELIMKTYSKLKDTEKLKFTSPIRRFHDIMVHLLVQELLEIEQSISSLEKNIEEKHKAELAKHELIKQELAEEGLVKEELSKQEPAQDDEEEAKEVENEKNKQDENEGPGNKNKENEKNKGKGKKNQKEKKIKTRYQIFQKLDQDLISSLNALRKAPKKIKAYLEENSISNERGMDIAKREIEIMEICKRIISDCDDIVSTAIIVKIDWYKVSVFLVEFSQEYVLGNRCIRKGDGWAVKLENGGEVEVKLFDDIEVRIQVKNSFPLAFDVHLCRLLPVKEKEVKE